MPLIISNQDDSKGTLTAWINKELSELEIVATYNLLFNASLMVEKGLGYAHCLEKIPGIFKSVRKIYWKNKDAIIDRIRHWKMQQKTSLTKKKTVWDNVEDM